VGSVGLEPTAASIRIGRDVALANKETLVVGGFIIRRMVKEHGVRLLPIDSEHSAIWQALRGEKNNDVKQIIITASGGAFRDKTRAELTDVTKEDALRHPNWTMGDKITIDSATMMNKGFEVIEAMHLFGVGLDRIKTVIHKESIVHGMVEFTDGSVMTHMAEPDMRLPIAYALYYPKRKPTGVKPLDVEHLNLTFTPLDETRYPLIRVAKEAFAKGASAPCVMNAANEAAVALFLDDKIPFLEIEAIVTRYVRGHEPMENPDIDDLIKLDQTVKTDIFDHYA
jgi:1-deoxy-D-xylulose-5-phosphate reductoisomerase